MRHLRDNNETYFSHLKFAGKIGIQLTLRGVIFILHGIFPFVDVPARWTLLGTARAVNGWVTYSHRRKRDKK